MANPTGTVSRREIAALPAALSGTICARDQPFDLVKSAVSAEGSLAGARQSQRKKRRFTNGAKNSRTSAGGRPALRNRFVVKVTPTQMKGSATAAIVARNAASALRRAVIRVTSRSGTQ